MRLLLFVEGHTEEESLPDFIGRWLNKQNITQSVDINAVRFDGWSDFYKNAVKKAKYHLDAPDNEDIIAIIGLLDLYGPQFYPEDKTTMEERYEWAVNYFQKGVARPRFRMFMAVHELEAWLLSQPEIFDAPVDEALKKDERKPETIDFDKPPKKLLHELYCRNLRKGYKQRSYGYHLFRQLDPLVAYDKCPHLKNMLDVMLQMARDLGL